MLQYYALMLCYFFCLKETPKHGIIVMEMQRSSY